MTKYIIDISVMVIKMKCALNINHRSFYWKLLLQAYDYVVKNDSNLIDEYYNFMATKRSRNSLEKDNKDMLDQQLKCARNVSYF